MTLTTAVWGRLALLQVTLRPTRVGPGGTLATIFQIRKSKVLIEVTQPGRGRTGPCIRSPCLQITRLLLQESG